MMNVFKTTFFLAAMMQMTALGATHLDDTTNEVSEPPLCETRLIVGAFVTSVLEQADRRSTLS
jgi:hypothetical protein